MFERNVVSRGKRPGVRAVACVAAALACVALSQAARAAAAGDAAEKPPRTIDAECPVCKGDGLLKEIGCSKCRGVGYVGVTACDSCGSSGRVKYDCPYCKGSGEIAAGGKSRECPGCKGNGKLPCMACAGKGTIKKANPQAAGYPTTDCTPCSATGFEQKEKCRRCSGSGKLTFRTGRTVSAGGQGQGQGQNQNDRDRQDEQSITVDCPFCDGKGEGPPLCRSCHGKGYLGGDRTPRPCAACFGTGHQFRACRGCRGQGWVREAKK